MNLMRNNFKCFCALVLFHNNTTIKARVVSKMLKDYLSYLFLGFRNIYFNKLSLDNMVYFHN